MLEGKRRAIIVGVDKYEDPSISPLEGAGYDAREIYESLKDPNIGNFEISDEHYLIGPRATAKNIRAAISDIFWESYAYDVVLFYFSGHGLVDDYDRGYLLPYDVSKEKPYVSGIDMDELKRVIVESRNKECVLTVLDCCHSGIATRGEPARSVPDVNVSYERHLRSLAGAEGRIILASTEASKIAREKSLTHAGEDKSHPHGIFSYYFIEGLRGIGCDATGVITLSTLHTYVEEQLHLLGKQKPRFFAAEASGMANLKIAIAPKKYNDYMREKVDSALASYDKDDLSCLVHCVDLISEVLRINPRYSDAVELKRKIDEDLTEHRKNMRTWLTENQENVRRQLRYAFPMITALPVSLSVDEVAKFDKNKRSLLFNLYSATLNEIPPAEFVERCQKLNNPPSTPQANTAGPSKASSRT